MSLDKLLKTIRSCKTESQLEVAEKYSRFYFKKQIKNLPMWDLFYPTFLNLVGQQEIQAQRTIDITKQQIKNLQSAQLQKEIRLGLFRSSLKRGDKVRYEPDYYKDDEWVNGVIKEIPEHTKDAVRVVYNCGGDWVNFENYTSALTYLSDLKIGWREK